VEVSLYHYKHAAWQAVKHGIIVEARAGKRAAAQTHYSQAVLYSMYMCMSHPVGCMLPLVICMLM
jgi:hypothetical protein